MMNERILVVGDIHGAYKALVQVLERAKLQEGDKLIFLGDYVDGWPDSAAVISYFLVLKQRHSCIFVKGNHDVWCTSWLAGNEPERSWLDNRGTSTVTSYREVDLITRQQHLDFFLNLRDYYVDEQNRLFIHAGFTSVKGLLEESSSYNFNNDRTLLETALALDKNLSRDVPFYPKRLALFNEIFIGHTPTKKYGVDIPLNGGNVWDIDTGAAREGKLSVMDVVTKEFWQSDTVSELYNDKGL